MPYWPYAGSNVRETNHRGMDSAVPWLALLHRARIRRVGPWVTLCVPFVKTYETQRLQQRQRPPSTTLQTAIVSNMAQPNSQNRTETTNDQHFSLQAMRPSEDNSIDMADRHGESTLEQQHKQPSSSGSRALSGRNEQRSISGSIGPQDSDHVEPSLDAEDEKREEPITALARAMSNFSVTRSNSFTRFCFGSALPEHQSERLGQKHDQFQSRQLRRCFGQESWCLIFRSQCVWCKHWHRIPERRQ